MPHTSASLQPIYFGAQIKRIEAQAKDAALMERAGIAAANLARELMAEPGKPVLVLAGPGNNGGDALVAARHLKSAWIKVTVVLADNTKLPPDAGEALRLWQAGGGNTVSAIPVGTQWGLVIDGLFGIGLQRELTGNYAKLIASVNQLDAPVLALDLPSGIAADTGQVLGCAVCADHTLSFIALKPGLLTGDGLDYCGQVHLTTLGLDAAKLIDPDGCTIEQSVITANYKPRPRNSNKGSFGSVAVIGGAPGMAGAALLAGRAALKLGAGRVYVGLLDESLPRLDYQQPELMVRSASEIAEFGKANCLIVGMGMGQSAAAAALLQQALKQHVPLVLDADALNLLVQDAGLQAWLRGREAPTVITPHPGEAARLLGSSVQAVQGDRIAAAQELAQHFGSHVVLKGAGSVYSTPHGQWRINTSGNPGLASSGTGDILAGMIGTLIAQTMNVEHATTSAVYLHGMAADQLVARGIGQIGLTASEVVDAARIALNESLRNCDSPPI